MECIQIILLSICRISGIKGRVSEGRRGTEGLLHRGGVRHTSANCSLRTFWGTSSPTSNRSVEPSSIPRPNHRPQGNLII